MLFFPQGGYPIDNYDKWVVLHFWKRAAILVPVSFISVYAAFRFGALKVSVLGFSVAVFHVAVVFYLTWILGQLDPNRSAFEGYMAFVEMKGWIIPVGSLLRDVSIPVVCVLLVRHFTNNSSQQPSAARTPKGAP